MIRKIVFSLICLIFSGMSVFATHIIMTDHALLTVPKSADLSAHVDFHEGSGWSGLPAEKCMVVTQCGLCVSRRAIPGNRTRCGGLIRLRDGRTK